VAIRDQLRALGGRAGRTRRGRRDNPVVPELPEVETIRRQLEPRLAGRRIIDAGCFASPKFEDAPLAVGATVTSLRRRGKYLLARLGGHAEIGLASMPDAEVPATDLELVVHLGMTGRLGVVTAAELRRSAEPGRSADHLRAWWELDDGATLTFHDTRRFGRVAVVPAGDHRSLTTLHHLGPEPFDDAFSADALRSSLRGRRAVKTVLLAQRAVAGVGNIYADEALWLAGIDPRARRLGAARAARLRDAVREVLAEGIAHGGTTLRDYRDAAGSEGSHQHALRCYGRAGSPCSVCGTTMRSTLLDARRTTWCPSCQR
jgi:formamidopyrimidine-DNA glycosylase